MNDNGTYAKLMEVAEQKPDPDTVPKPAAPTKPRAESVSPELPAEDLSTTPYISQNYRFTEDELKWLRRQAYNLTERVGSKVSQNTVLRVALHHLRDVCSKNPKSNPLVETILRIRK